jgi:hypothetical protein
MAVFLQPDTACTVDGCGLTFGDLLRRKITRSYAAADRMSAQRP